MRLKSTANPDVAVLLEDDQVDPEHQQDYEQFRRFVGAPVFMQLTMGTGQQIQELVAKLSTDMVLDEQLSELNQKQCAMTMQLAALSAAASLVMYRAIMEDGLDIEKVSLFLSSIGVNAGSNLGMLLSAADPATRQ